MIQISVKNLIRFFALGLLVTAVSCQRGEFPEKPGGTGTVEFFLSADAGTQTRSVSDAVVDVSDFRVELINSAGVIFRRWDTYAELKGRRVPVNAGEYLMRATFGDSLAVGFDVVHFLGEQEFTVRGQASATVSVVCRQGNVKAAVKFGPQIASDYTVYWAELTRAGADTLTFVSDEARAGFVPAGWLRLSVHVRDESGKTLSFKADPVRGNPADFITFNVDTKPLDQGEAGLTVTVDRQTEDHDVTIDVPTFMLPKDPPAVVAEGFGPESGRYDFVEGVPTDALALNINAEGGIAACSLSVSSSYLRGLGWPEQIDFVEMPAAVSNLLRETGLAWTDDMKGLTLAKIDFAALAPKLKFTTEEEADHIFTLYVRDPAGQELRQDFVLGLQRAGLTLAPVADGQVWATRVTGLQATTTGSPDLVRFQYTSDGKVWTTVDGSRVSSDGTVALDLAGLQPNTAYQLRAAYYNGVTEPVSVTTEQALQVGNGGFEDWHEGLRYEQPIYYPWPQDGEQWWDTNNIETMPEPGVFGNVYPDFKRFPTTVYTPAARTGSRAAVVRCVAVAWNNDNAAVGNGRTQGKLYLGRTAEDGSLVPGRSFASRPSALEFYFQYAPLGQDAFSATVEVLSGDAVIGTGSYTFGSPASAWMRAQTDIVYTDMSRKATSLRIMFLSSTSEDPRCEKMNIVIPAGERRIWGGSALTLDDVNLLY